MMSTGLTFGTISALYGYSHNIITQQQYSFLVMVVIASAVIPTLIAQKCFTPLFVGDVINGFENTEDKNQ